MSMMASTGGVCWDNAGQRVVHGQYFSPIGKDVCEKCKCWAGKAVGCFVETCLQLPDCGKAKPLQGRCCEYECEGDNGLSDKTELAVILSLSAGLLLLLIMLILILYCRRQGLKSQEESSESKTQTATSIMEQSSISHSNQPRSSGLTNSETNGRPKKSRSVELPPPYSPALQTGEKKCGRNTSLPPNEPPPPYNGEESAV